MQAEEAKTRVVAGSTVSGRIIAGGIVIAFCYFASSVLVTLLLAVLMAYFLDPVVTWMEKIRIPRGLGALLVVMVTMALIAAVGWVLIERLDQFGNDWPKYSQPLRAATEDVTSRMENLEAHVSEIEPAAEKNAQSVVVTDAHPVRTALMGRLSSLYTFILAATFVPFLVFFMLAGKRQVWHATMQLFPASRRTKVKETLTEVTLVLRSYLMGTALVGLILVICTWLFFLALGLDFAFLTALASGLCNLVPYLGAIMSWVPPFMVGLKKYHSATSFLGIFAVLTMFHVIASNFLIPALIGWRVQLNALALTVSLLFWGWLWGAMGFILAIPITAVIKVICDHVDEWESIGRWLSV
jgi:predicted PurR-regulated permease PerM